MLRYIAPLLIVALGRSTAGATSYEPWPDQRFVSENGQYYVVMQRADGPKVYHHKGPVKYVIAKRGSGSVPIAAAECEVEELENEYDPEKQSFPYLIHHNPEVAVQEGDRVLGRGTLDWPPKTVLVSSSGLGFVGLDEYGGTYAGDPEFAGLEAVSTAALVVSSSGRVLHRKFLTDFFSHDDIQFFGGPENTWWLGYPVRGWINEAKEQIVLVAGPTEEQPQGTLLLFMDWKTGKIDSGPALGTDQYLAALGVAWPQFASWAAAILAKLVGWAATLGAM